MKGFDQNSETPTILSTPSAVGGSPKTVPSCSPPKNHNRIAARLQRTAELKKTFGCGKNDTNTVGDPSVGAQISGAAVRRA